MRIGLIQCIAVLYTGVRALLLLMRARLLLLLLLLLQLL
jgi:hypothetical protein